MLPETLPSFDIEFQPIGGELLAGIRELHAELLGQAIAWQPHPVIQWNLSLQGVTQLGFVDPPPAAPALDWRQQADEVLWSFRGLVVEDIVNEFNEARSPNDPVMMEIRQDGAFVWRAGHAGEAVLLHAMGMTAHERLESATDFLARKGLSRKAA